MLKPQLQLENKQATPFTLLLAIYRASLALGVTGWEALELSKQCQYLLPNKISTRSSRKKVATDLIEKESNFDELKRKSYIRIHVKHILHTYHKQTLQLSHSKNIHSWTAQDLIISFLSHLIHNVTIDSNKKVVTHAKVWEFCNYMRKYFNETQYNGNTLMDSFTANKSDKNNDNKPTKGFGLSMMKNVCGKYGLKSGPYSKVKKQCNAWGQKLYEQSQGNNNANTESIVPSNKYESIVQSVVNDSGKNEKPIYSGNWSKFVTQIPNNYHNSSASADIFAGKKWFWFNDMSGFKWTPYRDSDVQKLNKAWVANEKSCAIINGQYRVEFDYSNPQKPAGNQYNNSQKNAGGRTVTCADANSKDIHGMECDKNPL